MQDGDMCIGPENVDCDKCAEYAGECHGADSGADDGRGGPGKGWGRACLGREVEGEDVD